ncbi:MAG TPA: polysaccharide deacetylase family protein [Conexibacter sp.]|jgi:peptidoglycan/xylan/chitin deacetylase (PgdA/CDA1 family)|nr:polysaccharide deacetylase family protein [Conexibacter sp.]
MTPAAHVCLTFDVDGEAPGRYAYGEPEREQISVRSWGRYGVVRGLPRIRALLEELEVYGTFFVPGATVDAFPDAIAATAAAGHEIAHHGYHHYPPHQIPADEQRNEIEHGIEAIVRCTGARPLGYRSPAWEQTPVTWTLVHDAGFVYDSSLMGDDRPYRETIAGRSLVELPVHWALDDFFHFGAHQDGFGPGPTPRAVFEMWWDEVASAIAEQRATTLTFHPEVVGHAWAFAPFAEFVRRLHADPRIAIVRCVDLARAHE